MTDTRPIPDYVKGEFIVNRRRLVVEWGHCDPAGIIFNPRFSEYFDWCCVLLLEAALGVTKKEMAGVYGLAGIPIVETQARFMSAVSYDEAIDIYSTVASLKRSSFEIRHVLVKDGKPAVECSQMRVWCGPDPEDPKKLKSCAIPDEVVARLRQIKVVEKS